MSALSGGISLKPLPKTQKFQELFTKSLMHRGSSYCQSFEFDIWTSYHLNPNDNQIHETKNIIWICDSTQKTTEQITSLIESEKLSDIASIKGNFASIILDRNKKRILLIRDKFGIKPLYYYIDDNYLFFASELQVIEKIVHYLNLKLSLNHKAITSFLNFGCIYEPMSIYNEIHKVETAHIVTVDFSKSYFSTSSKAYYQIEDQYQSTTVKDEKKGKSQLKNLILESVGNSISGKNFGVLLSGGIDSSLMAAVCSELSATPIPTFSIGFKENSFNEVPYAEQISRHLKTQHETHYLSEKEAIELIPEFIETYGEPYSDASGIPTMLISKIAKEKVNLAILGDGGDELFYSYGAYRWANRLKNNFTWRWFRKPLSIGLKLGNSRLKRVNDLLDYPNYESIKSHIFTQEQYYFKTQELSHLLNPDFYEPFQLNETFDITNRTLTPMEAQSLFDLKFPMPNDLIPKVERGAWHYGLETAAPLYTEDIIHFSLNLDESLKYKNNIGKYLLKQILYDYVPESFYQRPKWGFGIPLQKWMQKELHYLIEDNLNTNTLNEFKIFNSQSIIKLVNRFECGETYLYNRLWILILLILFLKKKSI